MALLEGKVALVTGAGAGIGRGIARRFVREGAAVLIAEVHEENGRKVEQELTAELGGRACFLHTDVKKKEQIEAAVETAVTRFGGLDILVNNAVGLTPNILLEQKTDEMLNHAFTVGLMASWWAMRAALPHMKARGGGRMINFFSLDVETGAWLHADYNITKAAIQGLTRSAAAEWGRFNICVNAIAPTAMGTVFFEYAKKTPGFAEAAAKRKPLGRNGDPEADIAPVAVFLACEMSRYVTGETIHADGGLHMPGYDSKPADIAALERQGA